MALTMNESKVYTAIVNGGHNLTDVAYQSGMSLQTIRGMIIRFPKWKKLLDKNHKEFRRNRALELVEKVMSYMHRDSDIQTACKKAGVSYSSYRDARKVLGASNVKS